MAMKHSRHFKVGDYITDVERINGSLGNRVIVGRIVKKSGRKFLTALGGKFQYIRDTYAQKASEGEMMIGLLESGPCGDNECSAFLKEYSLTKRYKTKNWRVCSLTAESPRNRICSYC